MDPEHEKKIMKERVVEFFKISGFKIICKLLHEQVKLDEADKIAKSVVSASGN